MLIREKMTTDVIAINVSDLLTKAEKTMQQHNIHHLPVLSGNKLSGVLSASDVEQFKQIHPNADGDKISIREVMPPNQRLVTTSPDASIETAAMLLQNNKIGSLPVLENGKMIGIITLTDILNTFVDLLWAKRSRIVIELGPKPGLIADVAGVISGFGVAILRIVMFPRPEHNNYETLISLDTDNTKPIIEALRQKGYIISEYQ